MLLQTRFVREFSQRKSQRLLSCNKNGGKKKEGIAKSSRDPFLVFSPPIYHNGYGERTPRLVMQDCSLWAMENFMLCSTEHKS